MIDTSNKGRMVGSVAGSQSLNDWGYPATLNNERDYMENKELPEVLIMHVADISYKIAADHYGDISLTIKSVHTDIAKAALSVIAPYYEKQIAELKAQIPQWLPIDENTPMLPIDENTPRDEMLYINTGYYGAVAFFDTADNDWFFPKEYGKDYIRVTPTPTHFMHLPKPQTE